ncbi:MAG: tRNA pseudouridine(55) synthase TruB [Alphaproteobacteria bacterium]|nr:tRNA pseudouridine(55) synthase TruB [Alphaproteobacteria bacterium]
MRRRKGQKVDGWVIVDKPAGPTSTQVVGKVRRLFDANKAGHGGTLDPLATGILPIALGEATKTVPFVMDGRKAYRFTIRWGEARTTDDAEGEVAGTSDVRPTAAAIEAALPRFVGVISQVPPAFSAIKVKGARAYDLARDGETVVLAPRAIEIDAFRLVAMDDADQARFEVESGKGAYMRALARDLALALGTVGHLQALRRVRVGPFDESKAISLDSLVELGNSPAVLRHLLPVETALDDIPALALTGDEANRLRSGQAVPLFRKSDLDRLKDLEDGDLVLATTAGTAVAIARLEQGMLAPVRVLHL